MKIAQTWPPPLPFFCFFAFLLCYLHHLRHHSFLHSFRFLPSFTFLRSFVPPPSFIFLRSFIPFIFFPLPSPSFLFLPSLLPSSSFLPSFLHLPSFFPPFLLFFERFMFSCTIIKKKGRREGMGDGGNRLRDLDGKEENGRQKRREGTEEREKERKRETTGSNEGQAGRQEGRTEGDIFRRTLR